MGKIETELERIRISDFSDVGEQDKHFFLSWNNFVKNAKKGRDFIEREEMVQMLEQFASKGAETNLSRTSIFIHCWTLWSAGRIIG